MDNQNNYADLREFKSLLEKRGTSEITGFLGEYIRKSPGSINPERSSILKGLQEVYSDLDSKALCDWFDNTIQVLIKKNVSTQEIEGSKLLMIEKVILGPES